MSEEHKVDELTARAQKRVGAQVREKWRLDELLGVGGMAAVYAATHRNGRRVAMKILHRETALSDDSRARFLREGYVANAVAHPGAVSVIDDDVTEDGAPFFTMDLLHGETLDQRVRRKGRLEPAEVLAATHQLLDVLSAAHGKGIVHRDIKPENVFLTTDAKVKVLDFGIAHLQELQEISTRTGTQSGQSMGTPSFMPPEQARGRWEEVDARSDLWAVGATMFTLLTGHHVHEADTMNEVLLGAMSAPAKPIALYRPELPPEVCEIVDRALSYDKDDRWPTAADMQLAVREAYAAMNESLDDLTREPTLAATSVRGAGIAPPAPIPILNAPTMTTGRPTTRAAGEETPLPEPPQETRRLGLAAFALAFAVVALGVVVVASSGSGAPGPTATAPDSAANMTTAAPSIAPADEPAPPATGAAIVTVQPSEPPTPEPGARVAPAPPPHPVHPHHAPAPTPAPAPSPPPAASAPPAPPPPPADPLNRRH